MNLYVMDTDRAGFLQHEHPTVLSRINALPDADTLATTIITFGEDLTGWLPACRRAIDGTARAQAYQRLQAGLEFYREMICLPFDSRNSNHGAGRLTIARTKPPQDYQQRPKHHEHQKSLEM